MDKQLADALVASIGGRDSRWQDDLARWQQDHPEYTRERYMAERNEAIHARQERELDAADAKRTQDRADNRAFFIDLLERNPAAAAREFREWVKDADDEVIDRKLGADLRVRLRAAVAANPSKKAWKDGRVITLQGAPKDRSAEPYWDQMPAGVRKAVADGRCQPIDESVAAVIWQHNRRVYRAIKDKTRRIAVREIAAQLRVSDKTVQRSITRVFAAGELEIGGGKGNHAGMAYTFPPRESEQRHGTPAIPTAVAVRESEQRHGTQSHLLGLKRPMIEQGLATPSLRER